jgi:hypothetical protein
MKRTLAIIALLMAATLSCFGGTTYTFVTMATADGSRSATKSRVWASAGKIKMLFVESDEPATPANSYILRNGGTLVYMVIPSQKSYMQWDLGQSVGKTPEDMKVLDARFEKVSQAPGGLVAGFQTSHYVFRLTYTMRTDVFGHEADTPVTIEQEYWVSDDPRLSDIKAANLVQPPTGMSQLGPELQQMIAQQTSQLRGTPLKTVMRFTVKFPARDELTTMTSEISDVRHAVIPASTFRIPIGFRRVKPAAAEPAETP